LFGEGDIECREKKLVGNKKGAFGRGKTREERN